MLAAGDIAGHICRGLPLEHYDSALEVIEDEPAKGSDAEKLRGLVDGMTDEQAETWLQEVFAEAERLLRARWGDVQRVAAALIERRRLSREDLWDLLPEAGPVTPR